MYLVFWVLALLAPFGRSWDLGHWDSQGAQSCVGPGPPPGKLLERDEEARVERHARGAQISEDAEILWEALL